MTRAMIIGGGVAGPACAIALRKAGIDAVIYEARADDAADAGAFLTIAVNGIDALRAIDAHERVLALGFPSRRITLCSGGGKRLGAVTTGGELPDGTTARNIARRDLHRALDDEARSRGVRIERGKRLLNATTSVDGGVIAHFDDGTSATGELLIGADGIHSRTRQLIDATAPAPRYSGLGNVGAFTKLPALEAHDDMPGDYTMIFGKQAFFGYTVSPSGEIWWFANPPSPRPLTRDALAATTTEAWKSHLIELFREDAGPAVDIIRSTAVIPAATNQHDLPRVPTWSRGAMIIIGDAAHAASPSSGQGASLAIEDGVILAKCLRDLPDATRAFAAYETLRRPRVERIVARAARMNSTKVPGTIGRAVRDLVLPVILERQARSSAQDWIFRHHIDWATPVASKSS